MSWTHKWLLEGRFSEQWIEHVPDNMVANYIQFRQSVSNNPPVAAAPNNPDAANPRLQGARPHHNDAANLVVEGVNKMRIMEFEEI